MKSIKSRWHQMNKFVSDLLGLKETDKERDYKDARLIELIGSRNALAHDMYRREKCANSTSDVLNDVVDIIEGSRQ